MSTIAAPAKETTTITIEPDPATQVLIEARELIKGGWTRGVGHRVVYGRDAYCTVGAIHKASGNIRHMYRGDLYRRLTRVIGPDGPTESIGRIVRWNDSPSRKKDEVLAAFDRAIEEGSL